MATISIPRSVSPSDLTGYARTNRVPAALLLFVLVLGVQYLRHRELPDQRRTAGLAIAALVVVVLANIAPDFVTILLAALLVIAVLDAEPFILRALAAFESMLGASSSGGAAPSRAGLLNRGFSPAIPTS